MLDAESLLERCRQGDDLAWEAFVRRYQSRIYAVAWHYMRNAEDARDTAQEIFIRLYERLDTFRDEEAFLPWMLRLARNACIDSLRRRKARPPATDVTVDDAIQIPAADPTPEERSESRSTRDLLYRALDKMSESDREILLLKEIQGLKVDQISSLLGIPTGTVKSRCNRARIELATKVRRLDPSYGT
ncbi:MAG: sigma-70 family RNA polymerase sigma factor [Acidobacteriota bacterium]